MEENNLKLVLVIVMLVMLASTVTIIAYQSGSLVLEGGVYLGDGSVIKLLVSPEMFNVPLNLTLRLKNPLNQTLTLNFKVEPNSIQNYVTIENKGLNFIAPLAEMWAYVTVTIANCSYHGEASIIAFGK
ncbi:MAG: hypothetical protein ACUVT9_05335 [Candidatus Bathycorpusculaceae bacterium]